MQSNQSNKAGEVPGQQTTLRRNAAKEKIIQNARDMATQTGTCEAAIHSESAFLHTLRTELHEASSLLNRSSALPSRQASPLAYSHLSASNCATLVCYAELFCFLCSVQEKDLLEFDTPNSSCSASQPQQQQQQQPVSEYDWAQF